MQSELSFCITDKSIFIAWPSKWQALYITQLWFWDASDVQYCKLSTTHNVYAKK